MLVTSVSQRISIMGTVQGVGFRPFVYTLAKKYHLTGKVWNTSSGVEIEITGHQISIDQFLSDLNTHPPVLARIDQIEVTPISLIETTQFRIVESDHNFGEFVPISPDMSICPDCKRELFDPSNRRFRYPFINCTNCGPRFSIIQDIPYDRPKTTMSGFTMCPTCLKEYKDPSDRRFHAQPIACKDCGPNVRFVVGNNLLATNENAIQLTREWLSKGRIIALKGLGGFHLVCDAKNIDAVEKLRSRKKRSDKPFALMAFNIEAIKHYCEEDEIEECAIESPQHPILLLKKVRDCNIPDSAAPFQNHLGFMLPYTPLHLLLLEPAQYFPDVFVMTSGNIADEPIAFEDDDANQRLSKIADAFLLHDRPIHMRVDDSVLRIIHTKPYMIRRSRGYAPNPILLTQEMPQILACGAELKNTFGLSRSNYAFISHHVGDLENYETLESYEKGIQHYENLFRINPIMIAADLHPDYLSTVYAKSESIKKSIPIVQVQHHHAHLASCLVDNGCDPDQSAIGLIFDGTGYGTDGAIWGGEVLVGSSASYERRYHLIETPLPGGDSSIRNPAKIALSQLHSSQIPWDSDLPPVRFFNDQELQVLLNQINHKINTPLTTSMGRLFDALSSLIGIRQIATYEGQAAIELENICDPEESGVYNFPIESNLILTSELFSNIVSDWKAGTSNSVISARFHNGLAILCLQVSQLIRADTGISTVALSGGVWQNCTLLRKTMSRLSKNGFEVLIHRQVPTNDGGISLGQLMVASTTLN
jgi:hydrogenase maturation protein HypF